MQAGNFVKFVALKLIFLRNIKLGEWRFYKIEGTMVEYRHINV